MKRIVVAEGMRPDLVSKQFDLDKYVRRDTCLAFRYEKEFDSDDWFEEDYDFTEREFKNLIFEHIVEDTDFHDDEWNIEEIKE